MIERKLFIFRAAATLGNFTEAAGALGMTQPNVTRQIALLEEELGVKLFERQGRGLILTEAGRALLTESEGLVGASERLAAKVRCVAGGVRHYRIGATMTAGGYVLPALLVAFMRANRDCRLDLHVDNTVEISELLLRRRLDVALIEGPFDGNCFFSSPLLRDELLIVAAPTLAAASDFTLADYLARGGRFILREAGSGTRHHFYEYLRRHELPPPPETSVVESNSFEAIKRMVCDGFGITVISQLAVREELARETLVALEVAGEGIRRDMNFIYLPTAELKFVERLVAFCRKAFPVR